MNAVTQIRDSSLTELEWQVVEIARATRFLRNFFGLPVARRLTNEKLEALRRFCVRAWYSDLIRSKDLRMLMNAGYTSTAVFQILAHIAGCRRFTPSIQEVSA